MIEKRNFVARERELAQLAGFLERALAAQGSVCFVTGEAGSGKTTLVTEFARRAQAQHAHLAVAVGQSDAQTGMGDAHLPFREVLGQLTGDVEAKLAQGDITQENAGRLRKLLVLSSQALVEVGPDLIGVFVPGAGLAARVGAFAADKVGWLDKLEQLVGKRQKGAAQADSGIEQSHIFEQYANVLGKLSEKHPLLLVLDDLQWADAASIGLLFRLARRIGEHRILLVGTYRPEEIAIGRSGERHPLEKVLAELKRYYGDIWVDLDRAEEDEGRYFVNAFLNTEPNQLDEQFRQKLYQHTGGHPLFTIELLRNMQERGDLVQNAQGRWVQTPVLDWDSMPERVEGVIEERIGRLEQELRQMLTIGSVEGEDFTAEVIARVQATDVPRQVHRLSAELERQHRLVKARGIRRLDPTGQRLSLYRFQHNLFRTYLYGELGEAERAYLHEDVGKVLEELYGDQVDEIVVQLAAHFDQAGRVDKAIHYLRWAGEQAVKRFANAEAARYFSRALALIPETDACARQPEELIQRYKLYLAREEVYATTGERQAQRQDLAALCQLVEMLGDEAKRAEVSLREARYAEMVGDYPAALAVLGEAVAAARAAQDVPQEARALRAMGFILWRKGDYKESRIQLEQALSLARSAALREVEASTLHSLAVVHWRLGKLEEARFYAQQCLELSRALGVRRTLTNALNVLGNIELSQGEYEAAKTNYAECLRNDTEMGDLRGQAMSQGNLGIVAEIQGDYPTAMQRFRQVGAIFQEIGDRNSEARAYAHMGVNAKLQGAYEECRASYEQALEMYQEIDDHQGQVWVRTLLCRLLRMVGDLGQANAHIQEALRLAKEQGMHGMEAAAWTALARIHECRGELGEAAAAYQRGLDVDRELGDDNKVMEDMAGLARVAMAQGDTAQARGLVEQILRYAEQQPIQGTADDPLEVYLTCYQVLRALEDAQAGDVLRMAYHLLQEQASRISNPAMRRSYLENVPPHREIAVEFAKNRVIGGQPRGPTQQLSTLLP